MMDVIFLNKKFELTCVIDAYKSFIWTDRYDEAGDFELYMPMNANILNAVHLGDYVVNPNSEHVMIVESFLFETDPEEGDFLSISGRSLETILERRIVWGYREFVGAVDSKGNVTYPKLQKCVKTLMEENVINAIETRKISNFIFEETTDSRITDIDFEAQYFGDDLYAVVSNICKEHELGFKITLSDDNKFVFKLYKGVEREIVRFSPKLDNILGTSYLESIKNLRNVTLIGGDGEGEKRETDVVEITNTLNVGLDRREIFTDANGVSKSDTNGDRYYALLQQKGIDTLMEHAYIKTFEGEAIPDMVFKYGVDYFVGDIVTVVDKYGNEGTSRITEFVISCDENGVNTYPTFTSIQKGVYEV